MMQWQQWPQQGQQQQWGQPQWGVQQWGGGVQQAQWGGGGQPQWGPQQQQQGQQQQQQQQQLQQWPQQQVGGSQANDGYIVCCVPVMNGMQQNMQGMQMQGGQMMMGMGQQMQGMPAQGGQMMMGMGMGGVMTPVMNQGFQGQFNGDFKGNYKGGKGGGKLSRTGLSPDEDANWRSRPSPTGAPVGKGPADSAMYLSRSAVTSSMKRPKEVGTWIMTTMFESIKVNPGPRCCYNDGMMMKASTVDLPVLLTSHSLLCLWALSQDTLSRQ